jgi:hypothetical protein
MTNSSDNQRGLPDITVRVNGEELPLNPFVQGFVASTVKGMISALKGPPEPRTIDIHLDVQREE